MSSPELVIRPLEVKHIQLVASESGNFNAIIMTKDSSFMAAFERPSDCMQFETFISHARDLDREIQRSKRGIIDSNVQLLEHLMATEGVKSVEQKMMAKNWRRSRKNLENI